jgi:hypothetical protein
MLCGHTGETPWVKRLINYLAARLRQRHQIQAEAAFPVVALIWFVRRGEIRWHHPFRD